MIANPVDPAPQTPHRWSLADDYLADPAVAPMRALLAALVRRLNRARDGERPAETHADGAAPNRDPSA